MHNKLVRPSHPKGRALGYLADGAWASFLEAESVSADSCIVRPNDKTSAKLSRNQPPGITHQ